MDVRLDGKTVKKIIQLDKKVSKNKISIDWWNFQ